MFKVDRYETIENILNGSSNRLREKYFIKHNEDVYNKIISFSDIETSFKYKVWHWVNDEPDYIYCYCGNRVSEKMNWVQGYKEYCSNKCSSNSIVVKDKLKTTNLLKYGVDSYSKTDEYKNKIKNTCEYKYGVDNYSKTDEYKIKSKQTYLNKYGVDNYTKTDEYKIKSKQTYLNKYGVDNYIKTEEYKEKSKKTRFDKYGSDNYRDSNISRSKYYISYEGYENHRLKCDRSIDHSFIINTDNYYGRFYNNIGLCTICNPIGDLKSIKEKELFDFIKNIYSGEIITGYRDNLEIDIFLPELKLGFEFNGLYWHCEKFKDKDYHLDKTIYFSKRDIRIIHIWEDDWVYKTNIIKSQVSNIIQSNNIRIFARKCCINNVTLEEAKIFLNNNHIQGFVNSSFKIGLYYDSELIAIMTFDSFEGRKKMEKGGYNLNRFCNKIGYNVVGGASKLLSHFIKENKATRIISYADKDWSIGSLYYTLGFENVGSSGPDYKYIINNRRVHKSRYRKSKLNTNLTEMKTMRVLGINRIYDCGKIKFEMKMQT